MENSKILVVDDNPDNVELVKLLLEFEGFEVRTADSASEAFVVLKTFDPALILMDVQLPEMDGLELTRQLRSQPQWRDTLIVALSAYAMKQDQENARAAGCDGYITKPIDTRSFPQQVCEFLERCPVNVA